MGSTISWKSILASRYAVLVYVVVKVLQVEEELQEAVMRGFTPFQAVILLISLQLSYSSLTDLHSDEC